MAEPRPVEAAGSGLSTHHLDPLKTAPSLLAADPAQRQRFVRLAAVYAALWVCAWLVSTLPAVSDTTGLWFLPAGLRFCALLVLGWPGLVLDFLVSGLVSLVHAVVVGPGPVNLGSRAWRWHMWGWLLPAVAYAAVVLPYRARMKARLDLTQPRHSLFFLAAALTASALSALAVHAPTFSSDAAALTPWLAATLGWMMGDFVGIVILAPLLLVRVWPRVHFYLTQGRWLSGNTAAARATAVRRVADIQVTAVSVVSLVMVAVMAKSLLSGDSFPLVALMLLMPQIVLALRYNLRGALLAVVLLDFGMVVLVSWLNPGKAALELQLVMVAMALVGLWLGGAVASRNLHRVRNQDFATVSNDLLWETNGQGAVVSLEGRLARHLVVSPGQSWRVLLERVSTPHLALMEQALAQRQPFRDLEIALLGPDDVRRWVRINGLPIWDELGELAGFRGTATDVTRAHQAKELLDNYTHQLESEVSRQTDVLQQTNNELVVKEQRLQVMLAAVPVGLLELDATGCCRYINANGAKLAGCTPELAHGRHFLEFVYQEDRAQLQVDWQTNRHNNGVQWLEFRMAGSSLWCTAYWAHLRRANDAPAGAIMVLADATARRQQDERLWALAHQDPLTDLPNRNLFWDRCLQAISLAKRRRRGAALLTLDLDGFKSVNDTLGHAAGDALLQQVARRLKGRIRDSDTVARMGGDEFSVVMPDITDPQTAVLVATELGKSLREAFELPQGRVQISGSVGIALFPKHATTLETLAECADMAMYQAKRSGKNQVRVWSAECANTPPPTGAAPLESS